MDKTYTGEIAALVVAVCWAISATYFEAAGRKVGSLVVNYIRLILAFCLLGIFGLLTNGSFFPTGAGGQQWIWLSVSGMIGFFLGDLFLFKSYTIIGSRLSMLVMTFAPALTALIGFILLDERLLLHQLMAIFLIICGILMAFVGREKGKFHFTMSFKGFLYALGGALGQSFGYVFSKKGIGDYDPFAATQIRIVSGFVCFTILVIFLKRWSALMATLKDVKSMKQITYGSIFGPSLGVGLSLYALTKTETGIASALMALAPIILIIPAFIKGRHIAPMELIGAFVSVGGVMILFL
ncbi:MAG: DMT family transporter [Bacteroidales bacterium]|nr:DMT family transporter [Bacteroidales bacterium]